MAESVIPVDLFNPGQVFACLGFVEVAEVLLGDAEGVFDWSRPARTVFRIRAAGDVCPVTRVLEFLDAAEAEAVVASHGVDRKSSNLKAWKKAWGVVRELEVDAPYPFPDPNSPATLVCVLTDGTNEISIDHWGDVTRDNVKFWAGAGGYPGASLARDALALIRGRAKEAAEDPFAVSAPQSSSFRLDWRRDYVPIDAGFSLNRHTAMTTLGYPIVELLAAIGLTHARPAWNHKLEYRYAVVGRGGSSDLWLRPSLLRAALGGAPLPFPMRRFRMGLDWPGQENQARAIAAVTEEEDR